MQLDLIPILDRRQKPPTSPLRYQPPEIRLIKLNDCPPRDCPLLDTPEKIAELWRESVPQSSWFQIDKELFVLFCLNTRRKLIGYNLVSVGTLDTILVHPREVFRAAIIAGAGAIVVAHNHPSGDSTPSEADVKVTRDLVRAGQLLKIDLLDHIIIGDRGAYPEKGYTSLRELGYFYS